MKHIKKTLAVAVLGVTLGGFASAGNGAWAGGTQPVSDGTSVWAGSTQPVSGGSTQPTSNGNNAWAG